MFDSFLNHLQSMRKNYFLILFFLSIYSFDSFSFQESQFNIQKNYSENEGLNVDFIKTMCFDNEGFLWLAGENNNVRSIINNNKRISIQRFDGKNFHDFELPKYKEEIVSIEGLQKRFDGNIYIRAIVNSGQMLLLFNPYTATFTPVKFSNDITIINALSNVFQFKNQEYILTQKGKTIFVNTISKSLEIAPVFSFVPETSKKYLLETSTQFIPFGDFVIISDDNFKPVLLTWKGGVVKTFNENHFKSVFVENNKTFVITADDNKFLGIDIENKQLIKTNISKIDGDVIDVFSDYSGNISTVILKDKLASIYPIKNGKLQERLLSFPMSEKDYIIGKSKDISQGIWLGTNYKELKFFKKTNYSKNFLTNNSIRCLTSLNDENFLVATENERWFTINIKENSVTPFKVNSKNKKLKLYSSRNFIKDGNFIWSNDHDNIIKVNLLNRETESWNHYPVICMEKANDSIIVYGTKEYYLMQFNTKTKQHKKLLKTDSLFIYDVALQKNLVVCATNKGMIKYNLKTQKSDFYNIEKGLEDDFILMVDAHPKHQFVLGTKSGKVITYNPKNNTLKTIYSDNLETGIATISYDNNLWWINTFNGLVAYDIDTKKTIRFSEIDGLSHNEGNRYSALLTEDKLLVGSLKGLSIIDKNSIRKKENNAELVLLSISKYDSNSKEFRTINNRKLLESKTITLPTEYKNLDINFALTNQLENSDHNYHYKIDNNNWMALNNQQQINFINLAAGTYSLQIEAIDFSGNVISSPLELSIISQEFFYKTWWFYLLIFVLLSIIFIWQIHVHGLFLVRL